MCGRPRLVTGDLNKIGRRCKGRRPKQARPRGESPTLRGRAAAVTFAPCPHRGDVVGRVTQCGCGIPGGMPVAICPLVAGGHCTPRNLGAKGDWAAVTGSEVRPTACSTCKLRPTVPPENAEA